MKKRREQNIAPMAVLQHTAGESEAVADILQNDISQTLAAVLLLLQSAMEHDQFADSLQLQLAESNLRRSIKQVVGLHYALLQVS